MDTITVCMGSSCFGRGNSTIAEYVTQFVSRNNLLDKIEVLGCLCGNDCAKGPNIKINDKLISGISEQTIDEIIVKELGLEL